MIDKKMAAVFSEIHENQRTTLHGPNLLVEFMNVTPRGTLSSHWTLAS